jgi:hypothetical protein
MTISDKVKGLLAMTGKRQTDLCEVLEMSSKQSMSNKIKNNRWFASDLIKVADLCGCKLAFILPDGQQLILEDET